MGNVLFSCEHIFFREVIVKYPTADFQFIEITDVMHILISFNALATKTNYYASEMKFPVVNSLKIKIKHKIRCKTSWLVLYNDGKKPSLRDITLNSMLKVMILCCSF